MAFSKDVNELFSYKCLINQRPTADGLPLQLQLQFLGDNITSCRFLHA